MTAAPTPGAWVAEPRSSTRDEPHTVIVTYLEGRRILIATPEFSENPEHAICFIQDVEQMRANTNVLAAAKELLEALQWMEFLQQRDGEDHAERFERIAERFHRDTGYLRPGKDCRLHSMEVREAAWDAWIAEGVAKARAAIAKATGAAT